MASRIKHTKGERLNFRFNRKIKLEFRGARLTSDGSASLILGILEKINEYQRKWWRIESEIVWELLYYAKQKVKARLQSIRIWTIFCYKVDMGNVY